MEPMFLSPPDLDRILATLRVAEDTTTGAQDEVRPGIAGPKAQRRQVAPGRSFGH